MKLPTAIYLLKRIAWLGAVLIFQVTAQTASAHRGATNTIDTCRISVGSEVVHFTAYTAATGSRGLCRNIPAVGKTDLVFDYEGQKLRSTTVEFEITKEPDGTRVFYQAPDKIKKGTVDAKVDFTPYGAGNYLAHVAIVHEGEKLDSHLAFTVGLTNDGESLSYTAIALIAIVLIAFVGLFLLSRSKKNKAGAPPSD